MVGRRDCFQEQLTQQECTRLMNTELWRSVTAFLKLTVMDLVRIFASFSLFKQGFQEFFGNEIGDSVYILDWWQILFYYMSCSGIFVHYLLLKYGETINRHFFYSIWHWLAPIVWELMGRCVGVFVCFLLCSPWGCQGFRFLHMTKELMICFSSRRTQFLVFYLPLSCLNCAIGLYVCCCMSVPGFFIY